MFAQMMSEMLSMRTFESFRVYSLDTIARLDEALSLITDVESMRIPRPSLDTVIQELKWSLQKDPVAKNICSDQIDIFESIIKKDFSLQECAAALVLIRKKIGKSYKQSIEEIILSNFNQSTQRVRFRQATGFYCSHLVNMGYSKEYLVGLIEEAFFTRPMLRVGMPTLKKFFSNFSVSKRKFVVFTTVSSEFGSYLKQLHFDVEPLTRLSTEARRLVSTNLHGIPLSKTLVTKLDAYDEFNAMLGVNEKLNSIKAMTYMGTEGVPCDWGPTMYVTRPASTSGREITKTTVTLDRYASKLPSGRRMTATRKLSNQILDNFDAASTERLLSSISTAALSRTSSNVEHQLVSLWSSVEVLLSEPRGEVRILHYQNLLGPCVYLRHISRQIITVFNEMTVSYRRRFSDLVSSTFSADNRNPLIAFAAILLLNENAALQRDLCDICKDNPLALHRLWKLQRDYQNPQSILKSMDGHSQRVNWQIHRIYRARNHFVHAGRTSNYLDSLVLNLSDYYRSSIRTILTVSGGELHKSNLNQIVSEIGIEYKILRRYFETRQNLTTLQVSDLWVLLNIKDHSGR